VEASLELLGFWDFSLTVVIPRLLQGMAITLKVTLVSAVFGLILGLFIAICRMSFSKILKSLSIIYIALFRGTPLLLQILFIYFALPTLLEKMDIIWMVDAFWAGVMALSLNSAAYLAEIYRAGILSIAKGQTEAGRALGLSHWQTLFHIVIPQSYRRLIPPIVNELSALTKETSLVSVISLGELLYATQRVGAKYLRVWEAYVWAAIGYLIIVLFLSSLASYLEKKLEAKGGV
jgi:His/Glu/Gln/Arg/opine family amino acid ABC transporter permease subunit